MPANSTYLFEIKGDKVIATAGSPTDTDRSRFAREAETLQGRAFLMGSAIGMTSVSYAAAVSDGGTVAFQFAATSSAGYDAKGLFGATGEFTCNSIIHSLD